jgi:DNA-binding beta-propeller fold protein YncE
MARARRFAVLLVFLLPLASTARAVLIDVGGAPAALAINPVTNAVYVIHSGAFANTLTRIDGATHAFQTVTLPGNVSALLVDPIQNRVFAWYGNQSTIYVIDGASLAVQTATPPGSELQVDPGANRLYRLSGTNVIVIDGATWGVQTVPLGPSPYTLISLRVNPVDGTVAVAHDVPQDPNIGPAVGTYLEKIGGNPPAILVSRLFAEGFLSFAPGSIAEDPFANRAFAYSLQSGTHTRVDWATGATAWRNGSIGALDWASHYYWQPSSNPLDGGAYGVRRINADTMAIDGVNQVGSPAVAWFTLNPATRRLYVSSFSSDVLAFDADTGASSTLVSHHFIVGLNPSTSKLYEIAGAGTPGVIEFDEPVAAAVPMPTTVTSGEPTPDGDVTVDFSSTSSWAPIDHPVHRIFFQVDSVDGAWTAASPTGPNASAALVGLAPGAHTIYAFATDGQETALYRGQPLLTGPIASAGVVVPAPSACANGLDDDGDGLADFPSDPGCHDATGTLENPRCDNNVDDDGDGMIDWDGGASAATPDPQCAAKPWRNSESASSCGVGAELVVAFALLGWARRSLRIG